MAKYPIRQSLKNMAEIIGKASSCFCDCHILTLPLFIGILSQILECYFDLFYIALWFQQVTQIDNDLKSKAQAYNNLKGSLQSLERKSTYARFHNLSDEPNSFWSCRELMDVFGKLVWLNGLIW